MVHRFDVTDYLSLYSTDATDPYRRQPPDDDRYLALIAHGHIHANKKGISPVTRVRGVPLVCFQVGHGDGNNVSDFESALEKDFANGPDDEDWPPEHRYDRDTDVPNYLLRKDLVKTWKKHSTTAAATSDYVNEAYIRTLFNGLSDRIDIIGPRRRRGLFNWSGTSVQLQQVFAFLENLNTRVGGGYYSALLCGNCRDVKPA